MRDYVELQPVKEKSSDYDAIEKRIKAYFREALYLPLMRELKLPEKTLKNSRMSMIDALMDGRVTYSGGAFRGKFNSQVSKELRAIGAKWDARTSSFRLAAADLPPEIREVIAVADMRFGEKVARIDRTLAQNLPADIAGNLRFSDLFDAALWKVDRDLRKTLKEITVAPKLTDAQRQRVAAEWQENLDLWIKDFAAEEIVRLRKDILTSTRAGNRYESLIKSVEKSYGVTANKAKFLAQQETSLLMAKFKETRYQDAGVNEYKWRCVRMPHDRTPAQHTPGNVRYSHGLLDGKIFRFDDPPVTTPPGETPRRNNPGTDYRCRCTAVPVVRFRREAAA